MAYHLISAARKFAISTLIIALRNKTSIQNYITKNHPNIEIPSELEGKTITQPEIEFIKLFKTKKTERQQILNGYKELPQDGIIKKLGSEFSVIIKELETEIAKHNNSDSPQKVFEEKVEELLNKEEKKDNKDDIAFLTGVKDTNTEIDAEAKAEAKGEGEREGEDNPEAHAAVVAADGADGAVQTKNQMIQKKQKEEHPKHA